MYLLNAMLSFQNQTKGSALVLKLVDPIPYSGMDAPIHRLAGSPEGKE